MDINTFTPYDKCFIHHWTFFTIHDKQVVIGYDKESNRGIVTIGMKSYYIPHKIVTFKDCLVGLGYTHDEIATILSQKGESIANLPWEDEPWEEDKIDFEY